ncbi:SICA antigen [Plasmodium coatneyi]|uniref:SICA antigen n=1 Tax=Plasmodium coatneyi TaxID=208452 RepID=A0A1B1E2C5_9APIC|nr:SICA antigen [Plasmodium coatneyi]ANQ09184.1 SICA antigen [Plasmodium coatneyi]
MDKTDPAHRTAFWGDIENVVKKLAEALNKKDETKDDLSEKITDKCDSLSDSEKATCKNIAKWLRGIYGINLERGENQHHPTENQKFEQTIGCLILNLYAQEIKTKCPLMGETVKQAFTINEGLYKTECKSGGNNNCVKCEWDECANYTFEKGVDLRKKVKELLEANKDIKRTMSTISDTCKQSISITGWFTLFSKDTIEYDKKNYSELNFLLPLCEDVQSTLGPGMDKYKDFCKIMIRNIILTTAVQKQYEDKDQNVQQENRTPCTKIVKGIPVCDLLKVWMYYMPFFCAPKDVIERAISAVQQVRKGFSQDRKYEKCAYDAALNLPYTGQTNNTDDPYYPFSTNILYSNIMKEVTDKKWCADKDEFQKRKKMPEDPDPARAERGEKVQIRSGDNDLGDVSKIIEKVNERVEEEVKEKKKKPDTESASTQPQPPPQPPPPKPSQSDETKSSAAESPAENVIPAEEAQEGEKKSEQEEPDAQGTQSDSEEKVTHKDEPATSEDSNEDASSSSTSSSSSSSTPGAASLGAEGTPSPAKLTAKKGIDPFLPYFPLAPAVLGISVMSYLLWKYFGMLRNTRKRYRRSYQVRGPSLEQQIVDHVNQPGPREYYIVKERKPRSTPKTRRGKQSAGRLRRGVRRRMIIDIHLEVLNECQRGDAHSTKEDYFTILVQEFMGSEFIEHKNVPKERVPCSDSGFREERLYS